jgi:heme-degrading monooxygenase HmoA
MAEFFTYTTWRVRPGMEEEFVRRWEDWSYWSAVEGLVEQARLLRDADDPLSFVSFGKWMNIADVRAWRSRPGYAERVARLQELVESFEPKTYEVVRG